MDDNVIVLYKSKQLVNPVTIELSDFSAFATSGTRHSQTVDNVTFTGYTGTPFSESYAQVTDGTAIAKHRPAGQQSIYLDDAEFYIKPNMKIKVTFKVVENTLRWSVFYYVSETELIGFNNGASITPASSYYVALYIGAFKINNEIYYGIYLRSDDRTLVIATVSANYWDGSFVPSSASPTKTSTANGNRGRYDRTSEPWTPQEQWRNATTLNRYTHGIHCYKITAQQYNFLHETLWGEGAAWAVDMVRNAIFNPISGIIACHVLPVDVPESTGAPSSLMICGRAFYLGGTTARLTQQCQFTSWQTDSYYLRSSDFSESFLDWAPYLTAMIKLPFMGWKELDINTIMDGSFYVKYVIDIINGNCIAEIWVTDRDGHTFCYGGYSGNCAYTVPITANDQGGIAPIKAFAGMATSIAIGGLNAGMASLATGSMSAGVADNGGVNPGSPGGDFDPHFNAEGMVRGAARGVTERVFAPHTMTMASELPANIAAMTDDLQVHLVIVGPNNITPMQGDDDVNSIVGRPASYLGRIKDFKGDSKNIVYGVVHADDIPYATDSEKNEIEMLIASGVIL